MDAKEAREKAKNVEYETIDSQYKAVKQKIEYAANNANFHVTFYNSLLPRVKKLLEDEGFSISSFTNYSGEVDTTIKW